MEVGDRAVLLRRGDQRGMLRDVDRGRSVRRPKAPAHGEAVAVYLADDHDALPAAPDRGPRASRAVPAHAAGGKGDVADECGGVGTRGIRAAGDLPGVV